jgi:hypothetical protein
MSQTEPVENPVRTPSMRAESDPVLIRRARIARLVSAGQRLGYGLFLIAIAVFVYARTTKPTSLLTGIIVWSLAVGSVVLAPAIVFSYAVKAADREDRDLAALKKKKAESHGL